MGCPVPKSQMELPFASYEMLTVLPSLWPTVGRFVVSKVMNSHPSGVFMLVIVPSEVRCTIVPSPNVQVLPLSSAVLSYTMVAELPPFFPVSGRPSPSKLSKAQPSGWSPA